MYLHKYTEYLDPRLLQDSRYAIHRRNCSSFSFAVLRENKYYHPKSQVKLRNDHKYRAISEIMIRPRSPNFQPKIESPITLFRKQFERFAIFGTDRHKDGSHITLTQIDRWLRQAQILDGIHITTTDTAILFRRVSQYNKNDNDKNSGFSLRLPTSTAKEYNGEFDNMKSEMRKLHGAEREKFSYKTTLILLFCIRILCVFTAYEGNVTGTIVLSLLQFLVAPYSFFVSFGLAIALGPPIYFSHYLTFNSIEIISNLLQTFCLPISITSILDQISPYFELPIGPAFILAFFIFDQGLCFYVHYFTPSKIFTFRETMTHFIWGFLNTKTYTMVILLHMMNAGVKIPIWIWLIDANFQLTNRLSKIISDRWMHWLELFYHQHRMAHLPKVYEHAHKLHHYLHGTLSFDAHIYGNGMPEEFFFLVLELLAGTWYGKMPATLNKNIIQYSIDNKFGHTQKPEDTCGDNFHPDHHLYHMKNFGIYNSLMDMYFGTSTNNEKYMVKPSLYYTDEQEIIFDVEKKIENEDTVFYFTPRSIDLTRKDTH